MQQSRVANTWCIMWKNLRYIYVTVSVPKSVTISGLDVTVGLNQCLPLLHHGPQLVSGQPHSVEVGQAVLALKGTLLSDWGSCWIRSSQLHYSAWRANQLDHVSPMRGNRSSFWKNVQTCWRPLTWTSSQTSLNFLKDLSASFSFCRSARETYDNHFVNLAKAENCNSNRARPLPLTSYTRPFRPSEAILVPWVLKYQSLKVKATCLKWQLGPTKDSNFIRARPAIK